MKPLLFVLLAASLIANVALLVTSSRQAVSTAATASGETAAAATAPSGESPATAASKHPAGSAAMSPAAAGPIPIVWRAPATEQDLHHVVAGLRSAGYPPSVIRAVINQLLNERFAARSPNAGQPFWKRNVPTPDTAAAQTALNNERQALFEALLGPDARPSALLDADARERRYGPLADAKIDAIARIERDYNEMSTEAWARRKGNVMTSGDAMMQTQRLMEQEKLADLTSVLTPEELAEYEMRNSNSARALISNLRNVDLTAAEYARLFAAQKAFDAANSVRSTPDASAYAQRQLAQMALNEQARAVLGDTRFYSYLEGADRMYASTAQALAKFPTVTPATTYQVYQLQVDLQGQMAQTSRSNGQIAPGEIDRLRNTVAAYNTKLVDLVGPEVAEAYTNQGMGRIFSSFRPASRPANTLVPATK